jgi:hypothetical protein
LGDVAVVVDEDFKQHHRILAYFFEKVQDYLFLVEVGIAGVQNLEEDGFNEHEDDAFEMSAEVLEQVEEDGAHQLEHLPFLRDTEAEKAVAECGFYDVDEGLFVY